MRESKILLCKNIKLDKNYNNVLNYSEQQLLSLCSDSSHLISQKNDYSFIRESKNTISTDFSYDDCLKANYIAFQNKDYSNKWFFAFVEDVQYISDACTQITYSIDFWSTWFNKLTINQCFVKREHTNNDTIGANTIDENLDIGDVVVEGAESFSWSDRYFVVIESNYIPKDNSHWSNNPVWRTNYDRFSGITCINSIISGQQKIMFYINFDTAPASDFANIIRFIYRALGDGHIEDIQNMYIVPELMVGLVSGLDEHLAYMSTDDSEPFVFYTSPTSIGENSYDFTRNKQLSFIDFTPKNNKCYCYPYNYLLVTNNCGNQNIYKYENWKNATQFKFEIKTAVVCGGSGKSIPKGYQTPVDTNYLNNDESLPLGKFPTFSWSGDAYINWLSQNALNVATKVGLTAGSIATAGLTGAVAEPLALGVLEQATSEESRAMIQGKQQLSDLQSGASMGLGIAGQVAGLIGEFYSAKMLPAITGGQNTGDVDFASMFTTFTYKKMRVKTENLKVIDDYFTKYGYKTNRVKTPNISGRQNFNYIEIGSDSSIGYGEIPQIALEVINSVCKRGVTIWHNHNNIGNFSVNNSIV